MNDIFFTLPDILAGRIQRANEYMLKKAGEHVKRIGTLLPSDLHRANELRRASLDVRDIEREIANATKKNISEVQYMFEQVGMNGFEAARALYEYRGMEYIPLSENELMQRFITSVSERTAKSLWNLSQTTALQIWKNGKAAPIIFAGGYKDIIDQAVTNASLGVQDFNGAMRQSLRQLGESGLRTMEYESGYTRRLDSAVRMNLLEGIRQVNQGVQKQIGEEIGADGVEISAHGFCAPDHADIQGKQLSMKDYEAWDKAHAYPARQIGKLNCQHYLMYIIMGVSEPVHSPEELEALNKRNSEGVTYEGKHYTGYEATQIQRQLESQIRAEKDKQILAAASGDDVLRREAQTKINLLTNKYRSFSNASGLRYKSNRTSVTDFRRVKV